MYFPRETEEDQETSSGQGGYRPRFERVIYRMKSRSDISLLLFSCNTATGRNTASEKGQRFGTVKHRREMYKVKACINCFW
jgi:hypothetical protein